MKRILCVLLLAGCSESPRVAPAKQPDYPLEAVIATALGRHPLELPARVEPARGELVEQVLGAFSQRDERLKNLARKDAEQLDSAGIAALRAVLFDPGAGDESRNAAAQALGAAPLAEAELALLEFLPDLKTPAWLRAVVTYEWGRRANNRYLGRALLRLKYEPDDECVIWLAEALLKHGSRAGIEGLRVAMLRAKTEELRALAAEQLQKIEADSRAEEAAAGPERIAEAWWWIAKLSEFDLRQVDDARFVLQRLPDWCVPLLSQALRDTDVYTRVHAAQTLGRRKARGIGARDALLAGLRDKQLGPSAAEALGELGDLSVRAELERCMTQARDMDLAVAATRALGRLGDVQALPALRAVKSPADLLFAARVAQAELGAGAEVAAELLRVLEGAPGDAEAAAGALGTWISSDPAAQEADAAEWKALLPAAGSIESREEAAARRTGQARIVRRRLGLP